MKFKINYSIIVLVLFALLQSCGGADTPYTIGGAPSAGDGNPGGSLPPDGGISSDGCAYKFQGALRIRVQMAVGDDGADAQGLIVSDDKPLPDITFHFTGDKVTLYGDEFPDATFSLGTQPLTIKQVAGSKAEGTYDDQGNISLNNLQFVLVTLGNKVLPAFNFTTGHSDPIQGKAGNLTEDGKPIAADGSVELVGGFTIPEGTAGFDGHALSVRFIGKFEKVPTPSVCSGGSGGGVSFKIITKDKEQKEVETPLGSDNTLIMGNIFVPEKDVASDNSSLPPFKRKAVVRVQNNSSKPIAANFNNSTYFSFTPSTLNIAPDKSQDLTVSFAAPAKSYTLTDPPLTTGASQDVSVGDKSLKMSGIVKKAGPEITVDLGDSSKPGVIDMGIAPVKISGIGPSTKLVCSAETTPPTVGRTVKIINTGVRPLDIKKIPAPVMDDLADTKADKSCPSFGSKFQRMALLPKGNATCKKITVGGHVYLTDDCTIPPGNSSLDADNADYLQFKVIYIPTNAKSIVTSSKDSAKLSIQNTDPAYKDSTSSLTIAIEAALSKDTSDVVGLVKVNNGKESKLKIGNDQRIGINIDPTLDSDKTHTQIFAFTNASSDTLTNVQIKFSDDFDKDKYKICKATISTVDSASCAYLNPGVISQVPPMDISNKDGEAFFAINFDDSKGDQTKPQPFKQLLKINYVPSSSVGAVNEFRVGIIGTKGYKPLEGNVQMKVEFLSTYINNDLVKTHPTDSVDFRNPKFKTVKSGSLRLNFKPVDTEGNDKSLMYVTVFNELGWDSDSFKIENIKTAQERAKFIRLPSNSVMGCGTKGSTADVDVKHGCLSDEDDTVLKTCNEPERIDGPYKAWDCAFFYYVLRNEKLPTPPPNDPNGGIIVGIYNNESGEMTLPNLNIHLMNPYHGKGVEVYDTTFKTDTFLKATFTTSLLSTHIANGINYVPEGADKIPDLGVDGSLLSKFKACPDQPNSKWDPTLDFDPQKPDYSPKPNFTCYLAPRMSSSAKGYLRGSPAVPAQSLPGESERSIILAAISKFSPNKGEPDYVPSFMHDSVMWIAFQGRLKQCNDNWNDCLTQ